MNRQDFNALCIQRFTPEEVEATGAMLLDVNPLTIKSLDVLRERLGCAVHLLPGGMTTGSHKCEWHPRGEAVDFTVKGTVDPSRMLYAMLSSGFMGCGIYHNGVAYSYHGDLRPSYAFWAAWKRPGEKSWRYEQLVTDPRSFK